MSARIRFWGMTVTVGLIIILLAGIFSRGVHAVETNLYNVMDKDVYLPLVIYSENVIPTPIILPEASFEYQVMMLTNQERLNYGCDTLAMDDRLQMAAESHSQDMAINDFFSHIAPDGITPWDRIHSQGYFYSMAGENIAAGYSSPESVVEGWMNSDGHRANIINCGFKDIGVG
jgi:uncharacterized protein YkwD